MGIIDQKSKIFGKIGAARVLSEGLPDLKTNPSFPSINNDGDTIAFLVDLLKSLVGLEKLRDIIVDTLAYKLDDIEGEIKTSLKLSLKQLVNCGVDPSIPTYIKSGGAGIVTEVNKVDFFDIMKTSPTSLAGSLIYSDTGVTPLTNSNDFNTFLYGTIQNESVVETWSTTSQILDIRFDASNPNPIPNNTLTINANSAFNSKTLTEFNNSYIDSIDLFKSEILLGKLMDNLFGSVSFKMDKSSSKLLGEEKINEVIKCIVNSDEGDVIDDSYFTFDSETISRLENKANKRKNGIRVVETCGGRNTSVDVEFIESVTSGITTAPVGEQKKVEISKAINDIADNVGNQAPTNKDAYALKINFIEGLISSLLESIIASVLGPKIVTIFLINYKIVYGVNEDYDDAIDFMKQNKTLVRDMAKTVRNSIISILLNTVLKEISSLVASTAIEIATEKAKNQVSQILSLVGIPQEIIRLIKGL